MPHSVKYKELRSQLRLSGHLSSATVRFLPSHLDMPYVSHAVPWAWGNDLVDRAASLPGPKAYTVFQAHIDKDTCVWLTFKYDASLFVLQGPPSRWTLVMLEQAEDDADPLIEL